MGIGQFSLAAPRPATILTVPRRADAAWEATRARVAKEGFGARLLAQQDADGQWAGGAFFPADFFGSAEAEAPGQPWVATTWVLKDLREWGLDAAALDGTAEKLAAHSRWEYEDLPYGGGEVDVCINSDTLASGAPTNVSPVTPACASPATAARSTCSHAD